MTVAGLYGGPVLFSEVVQQALTDRGRSGCYARHFSVGTQVLERMVKRRGSSRTFDIVCDTMDDFR